MIKNKMPSKHNYITWNNWITLSEIQWVGEALSNWVNVNFSNRTMYVYNCIDVKNNVF